MNNRDLEFWSFKEVEQRLIEAMHLWRRSPGEGRWPFASDAPWHLLTREVRAGSRDEAWRNEIDDVRANPQTRSLPLTRAEVAMRDQASDWLKLVEEADRRVVVLAILDQANGRRVSWLHMLPKVGLRLGADGLRRRYSKAIERITKSLNAQRVAKAA